MAFGPCTSDDGKFLGESNEERGVGRNICLPTPRSSWDWLQP